MAKRRRNFHGLLARPPHGKGKLGFIRTGRRHYE
jgi:hypothetical protein